MCQQAKIKPQIPSGVLVEGGKHIHGLHSGVTPNAKGSWLDLGNNRQVDQVGCFLPIKNTYKVPQLARLFISK